MKLNPTLMALLLIDLSRKVTRDFEEVNNLGSIDLEKHRIFYLSEQIRSSAILFVKEHGRVDNLSMTIAMLFRHFQCIAFLETGFTEENISELIKTQVYILLNQSDIARMNNLFMYIIRLTSTLVISFKASCTREGCDHHLVRQ